MQLSEEARTIRAKIREVIQVTEFYEPPFRPLFEPDGSGQIRPLFGSDGSRLRMSMVELIDDVERSLGVSMPDWLRTVYLGCNGFGGQYSGNVLSQLDGDAGVRDFTQFLRKQDFSPPWIHRAIVFGHLQGSGSITTHSVALDGQLLEWCYGDGAEYTVLEPDLLALWRRLQEVWDSVR